MRNRLKLGVMAVIFLAPILAPATDQTPTSRTVTATGKTTLPPLSDDLSKPLEAKLKASAEYAGSQVLDQLQIQGSVLVENIGRSGADIFWRVRVTMENGHLAKASIVFQQIRSRWQEALQMVNAIQNARERLKEAQAYLQSLLSKQSSLLGGYPDEETLTRSVASLQSALGEMELQHNVKIARIGAIERVMADKAHQADARAKEDPVLKELNAIAELEAKELAWVKASLASGKSTESELNAQTIKLARAKAAAAERQEAVMEKSSGDLLPKLNAELATLRIDYTEYDGKFKAMYERLNSVDQTLKVFRAGSEELNVRLELARKSVREAVLLLGYAESAESSNSRDLIPQTAPAVELRMDVQGDNPGATSRGN